MFRRVAIFRLDPFGFPERKNAFGNVLLICNDGGGGGGGERDIVLQRVWVFFGVCLVHRNFGVRPLAWCLRAQLCGRCSRAGPCVFGVHFGYLWGFRSEDVLDVAFCSVALLVWFHVLYIILHELYPWYFAHAVRLEEVKTPYILTAHP
jgi:hypothetical protein